MKCRILLLLRSRAAFQGLGRASTSSFIQSGNIIIQPGIQEPIIEFYHGQGTFYRPIIFILRQEHSRDQIMYELIIFTSPRDLVVTTTCYCTCSEKVNAVLSTLYYPHNLEHYTYFLRIIISDLFFSPSRNYILLYYELIFANKISQHVNLIVYTGFVQYLNFTFVVIHHLSVYIFFHVSRGIHSSVQRTHQFFFAVLSADIYPVVTQVTELR